MFETVELGQTLSDAKFEKLEPKLRTELLKAQSELAKAKFPVIILVHGVDGAGKGDAVNLLNEWMDARYVATNAFGPPTEEEANRPEFWKYWMALPPKGRAGIFFGSWYTQPIVQRTYGEIGDGELEKRLTRIRDFETELADDGALFIKLWFHISKKTQRKRFEKLEDDKDTAWRVSKQDWKHHKLYDEFTKVSAHVIRETSTGKSPWTLIEGTDPNHRDVAVARTVIERIRERLDHDAERAKHEKRSAPRRTRRDPNTVLDSLDLSLSLEKDEYEKRLEKAQARVNRLSRKLSKKQKGLIVVLEGWDAAGKGGAIRRTTRALDARQYRLIPIAAPSEEERDHHYLWRFWRHLPRLGRITIYDRSWYGRVLVERVEGFCTEADWKRAFKEINDFEEQLAEGRNIVVKLWVHISQEEQLKRFKERETQTFKQYKIGAEDYRNREKWMDYEIAANEMIARTSTEFAPWTLVEGNDKRWARVKIIEAIADRLDDEL